MATKGIREKEVRVGIYGHASIHSGEPGGKFITFSGHLSIFITAPSTTVRQMFAAEHSK